MHADNRKSTLSATVVYVCHFVLITYILVTPIFAPWFFLPGHIGLCWLLMGHWLTNNNTCAWTTLEAKLRGVPVKSSFLYSIIGPAFEQGRFSFGQNDVEDAITVVVWILTIMCCVLSFLRLCIEPDIKEKMYKIMYVFFPGFFKTRS